LQGQRDLTTVGQMLLSELAPLVNAQYGAMYQMDASNGGPHLKRLAGYARGEAQEISAELPLGVGLVGQCAVEKRRILLTDIPPDYTRVSSGLGSAYPRNLIVLPVLFEGQTKAVIELASLAEFTSTHLTFLAQLTESIGIVLNTIEATMRTEGLLQQSQKLATELQAQQTELQQTNEELANKAKQLAEQNAEVERKNHEIEQARHAVEEKAAELALASKYKSEFLANMSHELRTPLNSILILAQQLADNSDGNLNSKQVEFCRNIHASGADLLNLISDILDLSKIESGTVTVEPEEVQFQKVNEAVERAFRHVAENKHLIFDIELSSELPRAIYTDLKRLQQILKNLLSNAFKFTMQGRVSFRIRPAQSGWSSDHTVLNSSSRVIALEVSDTGIGIAPDKQRIIFEAFHQADAGTSRRFGGTGLGLAISRELATLLGGEIRLISAPQRGSTFTLYLPERYFGANAIADFSGITPAPLIVQQAAKPEKVDDDRESIMPGDPVVLIVEDDPHFARVLLELVRERGFKAVVTMQGGHARALAREFGPRAIILDIFLPDMLGWTVLSHLKQDPATRHIPVQIISVEEERLQGLGHGAFSYLIKPSTTDDLRRAFDRVLDYAQSPRRQLLIVEDNEVERQSVVELLGHENVDITTAGTGVEAWDALQTKKFDCMVLDLRLPDISGFELLERIRQRPELKELPIVVFTGKDLTEEEEVKLVRMAESVILKGVQSPERLLDETSLFLHLVASEMPPAKQQMLERLRQSDEALRGRKVLVVDDDVRNIFALTSLLEQHGVNVFSAETGTEAIALLNRDEDIDAVLMDIMMPEMDGYETMRRIRENPRRRLLPILALTAKAMKGDREKCLEAGASDYIAKPVNTEELLALLRIWLFGKQKFSRIQYDQRTNGEHPHS
ncbi:MAG TPA: response regulator, partial [Candidatus Binatia bacterium]